MWCLITAVSAVCSLPLLILLSAVFAERLRSYNEKQAFQFPPKKYAILTSRQRKTARLWVEYVTKDEETTVFDMTALKNATDGNQ